MSQGSAAVTVHRYSSRPVRAGIRRGGHPLDFADLMFERGYTGTRAYGQSKLAQIMSGFELASQIPAASVTVNSLHPATFMPTKIVLSEIGHHVDSLEEGVAATARLASDPGSRKPVSRPRRVSDLAREWRQESPDSNHVS